MNKEALQNRIKKIEESLESQKKIMDQVLSNINMLEGGKQECLFWLKEIEPEVKQNG